ncbi:MAG: glycosyltransferase, partial [Hyphomicrobiaceae bacterium]
MNVLGHPLLEAALPGLSLAAALAAVLPYTSTDNRIIRAVLATLSIGLSARYVLWRWTSTMPSEPWTTDWVVGILFAAIETGTIVGAAFTALILTRTRSRSGEATENQNWLQALPSPPLVDVFICTYNEDRRILERTIRGALAMRHANHRVWVLDDGRRAWLNDLCDRLDCGYIARNDNAHAKAGNINNALRVVGALPEPPDYIAILDADF